MGRRAGVKGGDAFAFGAARRHGRWPWIAGVAWARLAAVPTPAPRDDRSCQIRGGAGRCLPRSPTFRMKEDR